MSNKKKEKIIEWNPEMKDVRKIKKGLDINEELDETEFIPIHIKRENE